MDGQYQTRLDRDGNMDDGEGEEARGQATSSSLACPSSGAAGIAD